MSLRIWLPLNGDLKNQGLSNPTFTIDSAMQYTDNGKIGKAACKGTITMDAATTASILNNQEFSFCCWVYVNAASGDTTNRSMFFGNSEMTATNNRKFSIFQYPNCNSLHIYWMNNTANTPFASGSWEVLPSYQWTHIAVTYKNPKITIYVNGNEYYTWNAVSSSSSFNYSTKLFREAPNNSRYLNDYRIYDNCLSAAEVKEISQGLVLHYKLNDIWGAINSNLISGYDTSFESYSDGYNPSFSNQLGSGGTQAIVSNIAGVNKCLHLHTTTADSSTSRRVYKTLSISANKTYTVSFDYYSSMNQSPAIMLQLNGGDYSWAKTKTTSYTTPGQWTRISISYPEPMTSNTTLYYFLYTRKDADSYIKNIKIEEGASATPWVAYGVSAPGEIKDNSGYNHNGSTLNSMNLSVDTPRYDKSLNLISGNSAINCGRGGMVTDSITINLWCKYSTWGNPVSCTEGGGWNFEFNTEDNTESITMPIYIQSIGYVHTKKGTNCTMLAREDYANAWHMWTGVYDRVNKKVQLYVDGELKQENTVSSANPIQYHTSNVIWLGAEANASSTTFGVEGMAGLISDFRIYCTPLLDTDIKSLYNVGMKIDNFNKIHPFEMVEAETSKLTKTGLLKFGEIIEDTSAKLNAEYVECSEIIER